MGIEARRAPARARTRPDASRHQASGAGTASSRCTNVKSASKRSAVRTAGLFGTVLVVFAVLVIVLVSVTETKAPTAAPNRSGRLGVQPAPTSVTTAIGHVSPSAFAEAGSTITSLGPFTGSITVLRGQPSLTLDGKPLITYVGSNWCPYCAATRWPLAIALSRFGSFKRLHITTARETDPGIATLSFYGSTYTSPYIAFLPTEQCTDIQSSSTSPAVEDCNGYEPLQPLSPTARKILLKYDFPPYVSSTDEDGIPFIDFANELIEDGALMAPSILAGLTHVQIARSLRNPAVSPAHTILVAANYYTAAICKLTSNEPSSVCQMPVLRQATRQLRL